MPTIVCLPRIKAISLVIALCLMTVGATDAITITSGPVFQKATAAPLAGTLTLTADTSCRVNVLVNDGTNTWERFFYEYRKSHSIPLLGFKPGRTNTITITVQDKFENEIRASTPLKFVTDPLPSDFPKLVLLTNQPDKMEPGYTLFRLFFNNSAKAYVTIVDNSGEVVWYMTGMLGNFDVQQLGNGNLFFPVSSGFSEFNMLGQTVKTWAPATGLPINNHDGVLTDHGTILYLNDASRIVTNFPTSATISNAPRVTTNVLFNQVVEIAATNSTRLNLWPLIDMLDPTRISYLTFTIRNGFGWDCEHANALIEDPRDNSIIVSMRHQNAVIKFSRAGQLKWILGPHENWPSAFQPYLLTPVGSPFAWNYAQHAPRITPQGTLMVYDNGNFRASPFDSFMLDSNNFTRAVEFDINEDTMEVRQVWEYGSNIDKPLYTDRVGNAYVLPETGNVLVTFGNVNYLNGAPPSAYAPAATMLRIKEVTHEPIPEVVFDLMAFDYSNTNSSYRGCFAYRSRRIPDLYSDLPKSVEDLTITTEGGIANLRFSGNPARVYAIEASTNLTDWEEVAALTAQPNGEFDFTDDFSGTFPIRYYRVITR